MDLNTKQFTLSDQPIKQKIYKCPYIYCKKAFSEKGNLRTHLRIHVSMLIKYIFRLGKNLTNVPLRDAVEALSLKEI
jgi:uncharacterized Zn-finger protein